MKKTDLIIGFIIGLISALAGAYIFLIFTTEYRTIMDLKLIKSQGLLGKVITLGSILDIFVFFILLQKKRELMARGVVLAIIVLAIATLFL